MKEESSSSYEEDQEEIEENKQEPKKINVKVRWVKPDNDEEQEDDNDNEVKQQEVKDLTFMVDDNVPLRWLMILYCDEIGVDFGQTRFEFNGARIRDADTPSQLSMVSSDVIDAFRFHDIYGRSGVAYTTLCIRMHNARDTFLRVRNSAPLIPQLMRGLSDGGPQEEGSLCFIHEGSRLSDNDRVDGLDIVDGDIIDAFNFEESSSTLSMLDPHRLVTLKVVRGTHNSSFKLRCSTSLSKLVRRYCETQSLECKIILVHKGRKLKESQTVEEAGLEDGDEIHVYALES